jgi:hypothetical protein
MSGIEESAAALRGDRLFPTQVRFGSGRVGGLAERCPRLYLSGPPIVAESQRAILGAAS